MSMSRRWNDVHLLPTVLETNPMFQSPTSSKNVHVDLLDTVDLPGVLET